VIFFQIRGHSGGFRAYPGVSLDLRSHNIK